MSQTKSVKVIELCRISAHAWLLLSVDRVCVGDRGRGMFCGCLVVHYNYSEHSVLGL